jgi:hypothetical protein
MSCHVATGSSLPSGAAAASQCDRIGLRSRRLGLLPIDTADAAVGAPPPGGRTPGRRAPFKWALLQGRREVAAR